MSKPIAIVTGASTGIGKHVSIKLASKNFHVILIARNEQRLTLVKKYIQKESRQMEFDRLYKREFGILMDFTPTELEDDE